MKRVILLFSLIIWMSVYAESQNNRFSWGIKAGLNMSGFMSEGAMIKAGYQAGLAGEYRFSHLFALAPELVFSSEGWREKNCLYLDGNNSEKCGTESNEYFNYINLPVMAKFYVADKFSMDMGPQIGLNVYMLGLPRETGSRIYNTFQVGFGLGCTYNFRKIFVQARYNIGLIDMYKSASSKQYNIQIAVGYRFR